MTALVYKFINVLKYAFLVWFFSNFPYNSTHTFCLFCHNIHGVHVQPLCVCACVRACVRACACVCVWCMHASMHEWMCVCACEMFMSPNHFDSKGFQCMCATLKVALTVSAQNHELITLPTLSTCLCTKHGAQGHSLVLFLSFIFYFLFYFIWYLRAKTKLYLQCHWYWPYLS